MKKPRLPRKISMKTLKKMTGEKLHELRQTLDGNRSELWSWGWKERKLSAKEYVKHKVRVDGLINSIDKAINDYWRSSRGHKARMRKIRRKKK